MLTYAGYAIYLLRLRLYGAGTVMAHANINYVDNYPAAPISKASELYHRYERYSSKKRMCQSAKSTWNHLELRRYAWHL